jgi:ATP-dependent DNA ligase
MPKYQLSDLDLDKRRGDRRVLALEALLEKTRTPQELADMWGVHLTSSYRVLERLRKRGCVQRDERSYDSTYSVTEEGVEKLEFLRARLRGVSALSEASHTPAKSEYPDLGATGTLVEGPVALQRLVEVDDIEDVTRRIDPENLAVERKFDGWLSQTAGGRIFSRRGKELTLNFAPIFKAVKKFKGEHLIGELVFWGPGGKMDQPVVTSVAGTADPGSAAKKLLMLEKAGGFFQIVIFDLIAHEGKDISQMAFGDRREILEDLVDTTDEHDERITLSPVFQFRNWKRVFKDALAEGGEGVVFKNMEAPYFWRPLGDREPQPQGVQYKLKAVRSDDFVVFDSRLTEKKSLLVRFGQFHRGELIEIGEVDNFSAKIAKEVLLRLERGPFVMEIAFQERFRKPPGKLRNPRFMRFRDDKPIESAVLPAKFAP